MLRDRELESLGPANEDKATASPVVEFAKDVAVFGLGRHGAALASIILIPVLTRALGPGGIGLADVLNKGVAFGTLASGLGIDTANLVTFHELPAAERRRFLTTGLVLKACASTLAFGLAFLAAPWLAPYVSSDSTAPLRVAAIAGLVGAVMAHVLDFLRLARRKWAFAVLAAAPSAIRVLATVVLVRELGWGVTGFFAALVLAYGGVLPFVLWTARDLLGRELGRAELRRMLKLGGRVVPGDFGEWTLASIDRYVLLALSSLPEVGVYAFSAQVASILELLGAGFQTAWGPYALGIRNRADSQRTYARIGRLLTLGLTAGATAVGLYAPELVRVFATPEFARAGVLASVLVFAPVFMGLYYLFALGAYMSEATEALSWATWAALVVHLLGMAALVPWFGALGAAFSFAFARLTKALVVLAVGQRRHPIAFDFGSMAAGVAVAAVAIAAGRLAPAPDAGLTSSLLVRGAILLLAWVALVGVLGRGEIARLLALRSGRATPSASS
jgi:O-antigen/teichoic acid export membrane protein